MKVWRIFLGILIAASTQAAQTQISTHEKPFGLIHNLDDAGIPLLVFEAPQISADKLAREKDYPMFAGVSVPVGFAYFDIAQKKQLSADSILYRVHLKVPNARQLGLVFSDLYLPEGARMYIYDITGKYHIGAFTSQNNTSHASFSTHILPTESLIIEYLYTGQADPPGFFIDELMYIFDNGPFSMHTESDKSSGACNVNVNCPEGQQWQKQKRGVARILLREGNSWYNCTGSLVNNTLQDGTPYFLTANHCGANASSSDMAVWQFYFNYEYANCSGSGNAPTNMMLTGGALLASAPINQGTDFKLLELNQTPPLSWNPYYNGWTLSSRASEWGTSIHHPSGDAKKISTYTQKLSNSTFSGGMPQGYWRVYWAESVSGHGVTEGGSSGSPIFDDLGLITGTLTGGGASCNAPHLPDYYGKFYRHWAANGESAQKRLKPWLDPLGQEPEKVFGYDPNLATNFVLLEVDPPLAGAVNGAGYYAENEQVTLEAVANEGFVFKHWEDDSQQIVSTSALYQFAMPAEEIRITAVFRDLENRIYDQALLQGIKVFPNPASKAVYVEIENHTGSIDIRLVNSLGLVVSHQTLWQHSAEIQQHKLSIQTLPEGLYFLMLTTPNQVISKPLIIKH